MVCSQADIISSDGQCGSDCFWKPNTDDNVIWPENTMVCAIPGDAAEDMVNEWTSRSCDCSCEDMLKEGVEKATPSVFMMALSFVARNIVVTIVGLNMGFRFVINVCCCSCVLLVTRLFELMTPCPRIAQIGKKIWICGRNGPQEEPTLFAAKALLRALPPRLGLEVEWSIRLENTVTIN